MADKFQTSNAILRTIEDYGTTTDSESFPADVEKLISSFDDADSVEAPEASLGYGEDQEPDFSAYEQPSDSYRSAPAVSFMENLPW
jgi:hypothetical protein